MNNGEFGRPKRPEGPRKPTPLRPSESGRTRRAGRRIGWGWILSVIVIAVIIIPSLLSETITDWMWFASQNLAAVYTTRLWLSLGVFFAAGLMAAVFCWINWMVALRGARPDILYPGQREPLPLSRGVTRAIMLTAVFVVGLFLGLVAAGEWPTILLYVHSVPFGQSDPIFNNDVGFYVFGLPFYRFLQGWMLALLIVAAIGAGLIYFLTSGLSQLGQQFSEQQRGGGGAGVGAHGRAPLRFNLDKRISTHLSILGAIFLLLLSVGYWFDRFDLLFSSRAVGYGAGYTDVNARLPAQYIMMVVAGLAGVLLVANIWVRTWKLLLGALAVWLLALILVGGVYPTIIQSFVVKPSEQLLEKPYILNNIAATRKAFSLGNFSEREVPAVTSINRTQIDENRDTVNDIRLWDYRPLLDTFGQLQEIRSYYNFDGVDIDRYQIDGKTRQVMISARELTTSQLNAQAKTWQNQHLVYTHGYGAVAASVNDIEGEGLPHLMLKNVPPETDVPSLKITRPEIYYGEQTDDYVFVNSNTQEFDYPLGDQTKYTSYQGKGGVALSNVFAKLLFAVRFGDGNVMLSSSITPETRVLFHRNIHDAVKLLAPFLRYDYDPYVVVADSKMYWIQDAYTTSDRYPYSTPYQPSDPTQDPYNYIRNSVKVVISAYDGSATFYVADPTDPMVRAYRGIFPALFKDMSEMPADLRSHTRYPEELMNIQAQVYATYHMTDPQVFYNREDVWTVPFGTQSETSAPLQAYYTIMSLPGEKNVSFRLILPFTPTGKNNMIAWMAADSDGVNYGRVDVIRYPKQQLVYGPTQIEARIDQDPNISQQLTLWNQSGSKVLRGNLLVIPISNTVLYVEPLFLQAASSASSIPELKRVIVATGDRVGIGSDLNGALDVALGAAPPPPVSGGGGSGGTNPTPGPGQTPQAGVTPGLRTPAALTQSALQHYDRAQSALRQGDWATYGREIDAMKIDLDQLAVLTGVPTAVPLASPAITPAATPGP